jgi:hypothetical protein
MKNATRSHADGVQQFVKFLLTKLLTQLSIQAEQQKTKFL